MYWKTLVAFMAGGVIGSAITAVVLKKHYDELNERSIAEMKDQYFAKESPDNVEKRAPIDITNDQTVPEKISEEEAMKRYDEILKTHRYYTEDMDPNNEFDEYFYVGDDYVNKDIPEDEYEPYGISPDAYGENPDYDQIVLIKYRDGIVADETDIIIDPLDLKPLIGENWESFIGEYESDAAFIRNDRLKTDYQVLTDLHTYEHRLTY